MKKICAMILAFTCILALLTVAEDIEEYEYIDKGGWAILANSENNPAQNAIDGNTSTFWHSAYEVVDGTISKKDDPPFILEITLPRETAIAGVSLTPRQDGSPSGNALKVKVYALVDNGYAEIYEEAYQTGGEVHTIILDSAVLVKGIKVEITEGAGGYGSMAEIDLIRPKEGTEVKKITATEQETEATEREAEAEEDDEEISYVEKSDWTIKASSDNISAELAIDGDTATYWQSDYSVTDGKITGKDAAPFYLDLRLPTETSIAGVVLTPRQDGNTGGIPIEVKVYGLIKDSYTMLYEEKFSADNSVRVKMLDSAVTVGGLRVEIVKGVAGVGSIAEIDLIRDTGANAQNTQSQQELRYIDKSDWTIVANSAQVPVKRAIDGNIETFWHSAYQVTDGAVSGKDNLPFYLDITLPSKMAIGGVALTPRQDNNGSGIATRVKVYGYIDGAYKLLYEERYDGSRATRTKIFKSSIEVSGIRVEICEGIAGFGTMAEIDLFASNSIPVGYDAFLYKEEREKLYPLDKAGMTAVCDEPVWNGNAISRVVDGETSTFWQIANSRTTPLEILVDMGKIYTLSTIGYYPRQTTDFDGFWLNYDVLSSIDGKDYSYVEQGISLDRDLSTHYITPEAPLTARYFKFVINQGSGNLISCGELDFYENYNQYIARTEAEKERYVLTVGKAEIESKSGTVLLDTAPYIENGTTFIPLRGLLELMQAEIVWNGEDQGITIKKSNTEIFMQIRYKDVYVTDTKHGKVQYTLYAAPRITDNRTFIPIRFISEQLGYDVSWNGEEKTVIITK